jgi:hypothetical protein
MADQFPIIEVPLDASQDIEDLGTKEKFWYDHPDMGRCLFKKARPNTGEDWAEKIASELCDLLGLPHANYELATFNGENGIISPSFLQREWEKGTLITGREILTQKLPDYPQESKDHSQHTIDNVCNAIETTSLSLPIDWIPPEGINTALDTFVGYLLLDTWIGNSDRHHDNWGFIDVKDIMYLSPTYDHGSSLGRNEPDSKQQKRLTTTDKGFSVEAYAKKCYSVFYSPDNNTHRLRNFDVFCEMKTRYPNASKIWLDRLADISSSDTLNVIMRIPENRISRLAIEFSHTILKVNQKQLLNL